MAPKRIIRLEANPEGFGQVPDDLTQDMFASEIPLQHSHEYYQDEALGLFVGVWDTTDMVEAAGHYPCEEFMWLLEGEAAIKNCSTGAIEKAVAGEPFVIPRGYDCQWRQSGYLRKFFLIFENPDKMVPAKPAVKKIIIPREDDPMERVRAMGPFLADDPSTVQKQNIAYTNICGSFQAGSWESDAFESAMKPFPCHQLALVTRGELILTGENGEQQVFKPGNALFVPEGVSCAAASSEYTRIFFARVITARNGSE